MHAAPLGSEYGLCRRGGCTHGPVAASSTAERARWTARPSSKEASPAERLPRRQASTKLCIIRGKACAWPSSAGRGRSSQVEVPAREARSRSSRPRESQASSAPSGPTTWTTWRSSRGHPARRPLPLGPGSKAEPGGRPVVGLHRPRSTRSPSRAANESSAGPCRGSPRSARGGSGPGRRGASRGHQRAAAAGKGRVTLAPADRRPPDAGRPSSRAGHGRGRDRRPRPPPPAAAAPRPRIGSGR